MQIKHILFHKKGFALNLVLKAIFLHLWDVYFNYFIPFLAKIQITGLTCSL